MPIHFAIWFSVGALTRVNAPVLNVDKTVFQDKTKRLDEVNYLKYLQNSVYTSLSDTLSADYQLSIDNSDRWITSLGSRGPIIKIEGTHNGDVPIGLERNIIHAGAFDTGVGGGDSSIRYDGYALLSSFISDIESAVSGISDVNDNAPQILRITYGPITYDLSSRDMIHY